MDEYYRRHILALPSPVPNCPLGLETRSRLSVVLHHHFYSIQDTRQIRCFELTLP